MTAITPTECSAKYHKNTAKYHKGKAIEKINANKAKKKLEVTGIKLRKNSIEFENVYGQTIKIWSGKK